MAARSKKPLAKSSGPQAWEYSDEYPTKRGICEFCNQRDNLKLSFDRVRFICVNASACVLRWAKRDKEN